LATLTILALVGSGCAPLILGGVASGALVLHDRRSAGSLIDDQGIMFTARNALAQDARVRGPAHINVRSYNGWVILTGQVPTEESRIRAETVVRSDPRIRELFNELTVAPPSTAASRTSDALITARVNAGLFRVTVPGFDPTRVKVTTEQGVTYLMGMVSAEEADAASEVARRARGVRRVVRVFEYGDIERPTVASAPEPPPRLGPRSRQ
jgi:osmotically-inducible protein OsmY